MHGVVTLKSSFASETMEFLCASGLCFDGVLPGLTSHPAPCQESLWLETPSNWSNVPQS